MEKLLLKDPPSNQWLRDWGHLMGSSEWLQKKINRERRMREHREYINRYAPEVLTMDPGYVLDLGPGPGELLDIVQEAGHFGIGIDAGPDDSGGMGDLYLQASRMMHERQGLCVLYCGLNSLLAGDETLDQGQSGEFCFINSRGSIEQMFADCMEGEPHDKHHDCKRLEWRTDVYSHEKMCRFFEWAANLLRVGGVLLIHANGALNTAVGDNLMRISADAAAPELELVLDDERLHKWVKADDGGAEKADAAEAAEPAEADELLEPATA